MIFGGFARITGQLMKRNFKNFSGKDISSFSKQILGFFYFSNNPTLVQILIIIYHGGKQLTNMGKKKKLQMC